MAQQRNILPHECDIYIERYLMIALTKARAYNENHTSSGMLQSSSGESLRNINEGSNVE